MEIIQKANFETLLSMLPTPKSSTKPKTIYENNYLNTFLIKITSSFEKVKLNNEEDVKNYFLNLYFPNEFAFKAIQNRLNLCVFLVPFTETNYTKDTKDTKTYKLNNKGFVNVLNNPSFNDITNNRILSNNLTWNKYMYLFY
jgi:hypothetical protein